MASSPCSGAVAAEEIVKADSAADVAAVASVDAVASEVTVMATGAVVVVALEVAAAAVSAVVATTRARHRGRRVPIASMYAIISPDQGK